MGNNLHQQLRNHAVHHIAAETMKSLLFIKRSDLVNARSRVDVPLGLFGLSLDDFYARRKQNIVYLDVLQLIPRDTLERAKLCISVDDVQNYVERLFDAYEKRNMNEVLKVISDSKKMLTIHEEIREDHANNVEMQKRLLSKLGAFNVRERQALLYVQGQLYNAQNNYVEGQLVVDPIEYRYKLRYYKETTEQSRNEQEQVEGKIKNQLTNIVWEHSREVAASDSIQTKLQNDIATNRGLLNDMICKYNADYDSLDLQISYKVNAIGAMRDQRRDCEEKMRAFAVDKYRLIEWLMDWERKKYEADVKLGKRKKGKQFAKGMQPS